jgi:hypothetical protein
MPDQPEANISIAAASALAAKKDLTLGNQIYDPQKRSPIKAEPAEMCPHCGQLMPKIPKQMLNYMNRYINEKGLVIVVSRNEQVWVGANDITWYLCDISRMGPLGQEVYSSSFLNKVIADRNPVVPSAPIDTTILPPSSIPTPLAAPIPTASPSAAPITGTKLPPVPSTPVSVNLT